MSSHYEPFGLALAPCERAHDADQPARLVDPSMGAVAFWLIATLLVLARAAWLDTTPRQLFQMVRHLRALAFG